TTATVQPYTYNLTLHDALPIYDIARITKQFQEKYENKREDYITSQHDTLAAKYDAENKDNFTKALNAEINKIRANSEALRHQEKDRKSTRLNSSHVSISYAVFC